MAKIGIMGGTFDPVHLGHLIIAQQALTQLGLDKIWFMPAGDPPHKGSDVTAKHTRIKLLKLAIAGNPDFELFTYEADKDRPSYSAVTMTELDELYPDNEFFFIMGADSLMNFEKWYHPEIICAHTSLVCAGRNDISHNELFMIKQNLEIKYGARIFLLDTPQIEISSSDIRERLKNETLSARYMLPERVYEFVMENELYRE